MSRLRALSLLVLTGLITALAPSSLEAQRPAKGDYSVGILLFTNNQGSSLSLGRQFTDRLHLGLELDVQEASVEDEVSDIIVGVDTKAASSQFRLGPVLRWYGQARGSVVPFLRVRGAIGWGDETFDQAGQTLREDDISIVAGSLAIGAEWFPVPKVSFSGYTGFQVTRETRDRTFSANSESLKRTTLSSGTFTSALTIRLYFR